MIRVLPVFALIGCPTPDGLLPAPEPTYYQVEIHNIDGSTETRQVQTSRSGDTVNYSAGSVLLDGLNASGCAESLGARGLPGTIGTVLFTPEGATLPGEGRQNRPLHQGWFMDGVATLLTQQPLAWEVQLTGSAWCDEETEVCTESFEPIWMRVEADFDYFDEHRPAVEVSDIVDDIASGSPACAPVLPPLWNEDQ